MDHNTMHQLDLLALLLSYESHSGKFKKWVSEPEMEKAGCERMGTSD